MAIKDRFEIPTDTETRFTWAITVSAVALLVLMGRYFRDVNPA